MSTFKISRQQRRMIFILFFGTFVTFLNQTTINPALPTIMNDFKIDSATAQWLFSGTTLVAAILVPINASLVERFTVKRIFVCTMTSYAVGCALTAIAPTFWVILVGRLIQGVGSGILMPTCISTLFLVYPENRRGSIMGIFGLVIGVAPVLGPVVSGFVCDNASWHIIYIITSALSLICAIVGFVDMDSVYLTKVNEDKLDKLSVVLCVLGFGSLLFGFGEIGSNGFSPISGISILIGLAITILFFIRQLKIENPMLRVRVLKKRRFFISVIIIMCVQAAIMGNAIIIPLLVQDVLGLSATVSGLVMMPPAIVMGVMSPLSGKFFDKHGPRAMSILGLSVLTITTIILSFLDSEFSVIYLCVILCFRYFGLSITNMPINTWGVNSLSTELIPHGNSVSSTFRQTAGSFGTALTVSTFSLVFSFLSDKIELLDAGIWGVNAAFGFQAILCISALTIAIIFVKDSKKK